jgi:hypothetical protein
MYIYLCTQLQIFVMKLYNVSHSFILDLHWHGARSALIALIYEVIIYYNQIYK